MASAEGSFGSIDEQLKKIIEKLEEIKSGVQKVVKYVLGENAIPFVFSRRVTRDDLQRWTDKIKGIALEFNEVTLWCPICNRDPLTFQLTAQKSWVAALRKAFKICTIIGQIFSIGFEVLPVLGEYIARDFDAQFLKMNKDKLNIEKLKEIVENAKLANKDSTDPETKGMIVDFADGLRDKIRTGELRQEGDESKCVEFFHALAYTSWSMMGKEEYETIRKIVDENKGDDWVAGTHGFFTHLKCNLITPTTTTSPPSKPMPEGARRPSTRKAPQHPAKPPSPKVGQRTTPHQPTHPAHPAEQPVLPEKFAAPKAIKPPRVAKPSADRARLAHLVNTSIALHVDLIEIAFKRKLKSEPTRDLDKRGGSILLEMSSTNDAILKSFKENGFRTLWEEYHARTSAILRRILDLDKEKLSNTHKKLFATAFRDAELVGRYNKGFSGDIDVLKGIVKEVESR